MVSATFVPGPGEWTVAGCWVWSYATRPSIFAVSGDARTAWQRAAFRKTGNPVDIDKQRGKPMAWGLAAIMIVIVSWIFYRYFAPRGWREWTGAGLVQVIGLAMPAHEREHGFDQLLLLRDLGEETRGELEALLLMAVGVAPLVALPAHG